MKKFQNSVLLIARSRVKFRKKRWEVLKNKDFSNKQTVLEWLKEAEEIIADNFQQINVLLAEKNNCLGEIRGYENSLLDGKKGDEEKAKINKKIDYTKKVIGEKTQSSKKILEENDFLCKELENFQDPLFLKERKEKAQNSADNQEQQVITGLESFLADKQEEMEKLKEKIRAANFSAKAIEDSEKDLEKEIRRKSQLLPNKKTIKTTKNMNDTTNNKKDNLIKLQKKWSEYLDSGSKGNFFYSWEKNEEIMKDLLPFIEGALQNSDLKDGYQQLLNEWNNKEWRDWSGEKSNLQYYLNSWDKLEESIGGEDLTPEQQKELEAFQAIKDTFKIDETGDLTEQLNNLQEEVKKAKEAEVKLESYKNSLEVVKKEKDEAIKKRGELSGKITDYLKEKMDIQNQYEKEISEFEEKLIAKDEEKDNELAKKQEEINKIKKQQQQDASSSSKFIKKNKDLSEKLAALRADLDSLKDSEEKLKEETKLLQEKISQKEKELATKLEEFEKEKEKIQEENDKKYEGLLATYEQLVNEKTKANQKTTSNLPAFQLKKEDKSLLNGFLESYKDQLQREINDSQEMINDDEYKEEKERLEKLAESVQEEKEKVEAFIEQNVKKR